MSLSFIQMLEDLPSFESYIRENWRQIVSLASKELQTLFLRREVTHVPTIQDPEIIGYAVDAQTESLFTPFAVCGAGPWAEDPPQPDNLATLCIHWPRLLGILPDLPLFKPHSMAHTALMVWGFSEIFERRNIVYHEFLRRKLLRSLLVYSGLGERVSEVSDLVVAEKELFTLFSSEVLQHTDPMIRALKASFERTLDKSAPALTPNRPVKVFHSITPGVLKGCSRWNLRAFDYWSELVFERNPVPAIVIAKPAHFKPRVANELFREVLFMHTIPSKGVNILGTRKSIIDAPLSIVDMGEFPRYRTSVGIKLYENYRKKTKQTKILWRALANDMMALFQEAMPGLTPPGGAYSDYAEGVKFSFAEANIDQVLFIPDTYIRQKLKWAARTLRARSVPRIEGRAPAQLRIALITSDPIGSAHGKTYEFQIIRRGYGTYIHPPWQVPKAIARVPGLGVKEFKKGVYYDKASDVMYFTFKFLERVPNSPLYKHPLLKTWLEQFAELSVSRFKYLWRETKKRDIDIYTRYKGHRAAYVRAEDEVICEFYKPDMTPEDKQHILDVCKGRDWPNIRIRASVICKHRLEAGCIDMSTLPVRRYNARILQAIAANKKLEAKRVAKALADQEKLLAKASARAEARRAKEANKNGRI